jgi:putative membrane protein
MTKTLFAVTMGALMAAGSAGYAADPPKTADVLGKLHQSNQKEIEAGKLAEKSGKSKAVKEYGKMLVTDHSAADKKVTALAKEEKVELPAAKPEKGDMSGMATDPDFDTKFAREMVDDHKKDIAEVTDARDSTTDPKLKKLLADMVPKLQKHEETAQKIVDSSSKK